MHLIIYSKSHCPNCEAAKDLLGQAGMDYLERSVDEEQWRDVFTRTYPDLRQMPQIFFKGDRIGGLAGLREWLKWRKENGK